ncbi:DUF3795 domain-containing protein [Paludicola sp. MB14-C6]|uniref:DUF3795 domain-containing protein n=1 Tax=Paludihabitans sp. MB14-C6 TaxID=3070656 RepID=UPI0027DDF825|nr:DUF3795 domain-containing protein [Paludicola sp. MB14-C6]WMJ23131.1 DUF3795 domain-containing protein [Paludicola sp. MB14-C6]
MKPNNQTAAICGLFCGTCPSYPKDCHGCLSDKLTSHCLICSNGFRECAKNNGVTRCFECDAFPCDRLNQFSTQHWENGICHHAEVINDLVYMKENSVENWVSKKTSENTCPKCGRLVYWYDKKSHVCE